MAFAVLVFFILGFGARKAVLLDIFILMVAYSINSMPSLLMREIRKGAIPTIIISLTLMVFLLIYSAFSERTVSYSHSVEQRGGAYAVFGPKWQTPLLRKLFLVMAVDGVAIAIYLLNLFFDLGLWFVLYLASFFFLVRYILKTSLRRYLIDGHTNRINFHIRVWAAIFSLIGSNSVNMNLQLPYYTINIF